MAKWYLRRRRTIDVPHQLVVTLLAVAVALNTWLHVDTCGVEAKLGLEHAQSWMVTSHHSVFAQSRTLQEQPGEESDGAEESSESDVDDEGSDSKDNEEANKTLTEQCNFVTDCEMCFRGERSKEAGCSATGRRQKLECIITSGEGKKRRVQKFESCKRTNADEEFLFIRMQAMCTMFGVFSLYKVRKRKRVNASLFDQRKSGTVPPRIIISTDTTSNEMEPLTPAASSEVEMV